jgi:glycosyltransferase involved in cell wall biosynthesis
MNPKITVIIPSKDRANVLGRAVDSVLSQDYPNIEVLVINDGSTDNTLEVLRKYDSVPNLSYISLAAPASGTASMGRNLGLALADSEYVSFIDSDDEVLPHKFRLQMARMLGDAQKMSTLPKALYDLTPFHTHFEIDVCYTAMNVIKPDGSRGVSGTLFDAFYGLAPNIIFPNAQDHFGTNLTTGLFRKEVFRLLGGFKLMKIGEDSEFKDRTRGFGCNESFLEEPLYNYYIGSPNSLMGEYKPSITEAEKLEQERKDREYAAYKKAMKTCASESDFISQFQVPIDSKETIIESIHNSHLLKLDERIPMTEGTKSLLTKALSQA